MNLFHRLKSGLSHPVLAGSATMMLLLSALLSGCARVPAVKPDGSGLPANLKSERIAVVAFADPALRIMTVGGVTATTVATAKTPAEGITAGVLTLVADSLTRPSGPPTIVTGPSYLVASALRELLRKNLSLDLDQVSESRAREIPERNLRPGGRYVLEVTTDINLFTYRPLAWGTYQYTLHAHARILSPQGVILWQNACIVAPMGPDKTLQLDRHGFQANGGQRLREVMKVAADRCALGMAPKQ